MIPISQRGNNFHNNNDDNDNDIPDNNREERCDDSSSWWTSLLCSCSVVILNRHRNSSRLLRRRRHHSPRNNHHDHNFLPPPSNNNKKQRRMSFTTAGILFLVLISALNITAVTLYYNNDAAAAAAAAAAMAPTTRMTTRMTTQTQTKTKTRSNSSSSITSAATEVTDATAKRQQHVQYQSLDETIDETTTHNNSNNNKKKKRFAYAFLLGGVVRYDGDDDDNDDLNNNNNSSQTRPQGSSNPTYHRGGLYSIISAVYQLQKFDSDKDADFIVMIQMKPTSTNTKSSNQKLSTKETLVLQRMNIQLQYIPMLRIDEPDLDCFYGLMFEKFRILNWIQYEKVMYLDSDIYPTYVQKYNYSNRSYPYWDINRGWGHTIQYPDVWKKVTGSDGGGLNTKWDFYGSHTDQGLLYHYVKYIKGNESSIIINDIVEQYDYYDDYYDSNTNEEGGNCNKIIKKYEYDLEDVFRSKKSRKNSPYSDFIHFTANEKPWYRNRIHLEDSTNKAYCGMNLYKTNETTTMLTKNQRTAIQKDCTLLHWQGQWYTSLIDALTQIDMIHYIAFDFVGPPPPPNKKQLGNNNNDKSSSASSSRTTISSSSIDIINGNNLNVPFHQQTAKYLEAKSKHNWNPYALY
ncbi:hypothetical protein FRACYDRAFT_233539 [Fragilariopsis cylindrus CCMP1102]|uniref:Nucleotide-diphospho-sugar transferase n=1 Tax=Fragilariopsis cylindrus CCMP1102 TaxID=635003 RepID=A0A1E7FYZ6_9STRA|nr:hypothetical protein FRACYDRAFT_233539 [Fragilariopsis cylindrus CCMP1102]|eukprot:OEU23366.1 hypothetical protein FRACYDRAFT_233539 [Fragilariopsis cylindrus CCMP1102]